MEYQDPYDKAQLLLRYLRHETTPTEQQAVEEWLNENEENRAFFKPKRNKPGINYKKPSDQKQEHFGGRV